MFLRQITDSALAQNAYLIGCQRTGEAILVDPERDIDRYLKLAAENDLRITAVADTHIHADYLTGARELMEHHGVTGYFSAEGGPDWQVEWAAGHPRTRLLHDGDEFRIGNISFKALLTPGHTPEHLSFLFTDIGGGATEPLGLLSGDFIFVGDVGRPDLLESAAGQAGIMEPSARALHASLRSTAGLADHLQILPAHGAGSACGKALGAVPISVMGYERRFNAPFREALEGDEEAFVRDILTDQPEPPLYFARMKRDNKSGPPLLPGGRLPRPRRLDGGEIAKLVRAGGRVFLDLRASRAEYMSRHLRGSLFAPLAGGKLPIVAGSYVDENAPIILLMEDGQEADEAVRQLVRIGLDRIEGWIPASEALALDEATTRQSSITTGELAAVLATHPGAAVLDVRGAGEFAESHVSGATHIAYTRLAARLDEVPEAEPLYVHCGGGLRAAFATSYLAGLHREVVHVDGAFSGIADRIKSVR